MQRVFNSLTYGSGRGILLLLVPLLIASLYTDAGAFSLTVTGSDGAQVSAYRWMVEEDTTNITVPGRQVPDAAGNTSIGIDIHSSYAPVVAKGHSTGATTVINLPSDKPYFVTVLPDATTLPDGSFGPPRYAMSGTTVAVNQNLVGVKVARMPLPTAQIYLLAFIDHNPISNAKDALEVGLGGCSIYLFDFSGGRLAVDAFGNPLGTTYDTDAFGQPYLDGDGNPVVDQLGDGALTTLSQDDIDAGDNPYNLKLGEALIKYLAPGKYGVRMTAPAGDDSGKQLNWIQTATIEGTPTIDAWVQSNEPKLFVEGFGTGTHHAQFGFVNYTTATVQDPGPWVVRGQTVTALQGNILNETGNPAGTGSISGTVRMNHFDRPPNNQGLYPGITVDQCWVGLNDSLLIAERLLTPYEGTLPGDVASALQSSTGLYVVPCNADGTFTIENVPPGDYQIVTWDTPLDTLFGFHNVTVPAGGTVTEPGNGIAVAAGDLLTFRWFGTLEGSVFLDTNANGKQDAGEVGIPEQAVNLRFRDGSIYQATASGTDGKYELAEVFPFFKWLVAEVDFARYKATGITTAIDYGGPIADLFAPVWPSNGNKRLQPQDPADPFNENGDSFWRTETGPVLTEGVQLFLNQTNLIDWGKQFYGPGENGGISGMIFYDTTRAEDDPRYNAGEPWQPGVPRVQVNLYSDFVDNATGLAPSDGIIDDRDGSGGITLPDVDNFPFNWYCQGEPVCANTPGPEDVDDGFTGAQIASGNGIFDFRDAIEITWSDSFDDNKPSGCLQDLPVVHGFEIPECADNYGTWNQVRPAVYDGGYAFGPEIDCPLDGNGDPLCPDWVVPSVTNPGVGYLKQPGEYIVHAVAPPLFEIVKSQDKNVDFGEIFIPSPLVLPPECVGDSYVVPPELTLFPGVPTNLAGQTLNNCDRKIMNVAQGKNAAVDFFMFTEVPKAARVVGFVNNDRGAEFNQASPIYGEKLGVPWIPIAFRDWNGTEILRVYADEWGTYNALLPSTYSINVPSTSGIAPNMLTLVLNDPIRPDGSIDPWYNPDYSVTPWTFNYQPGATTYTDTPLMPVSAFTTAEVGLDTYQAHGGPVIGEVFATAAGQGSGPMVCTSALPASVTLTSLGLTDILNPAWDPTGVGTEPRTIQRDFGFGTQVAGSEVTLNGVALPVTNWNNLQITVTIPAGTPSGTLMVTRGDTGLSTQVGVMLNIEENCDAVLRVGPGPQDFPSIQMAIDAAPYTPDAPGPLILVAPGNYTENVIMYKPVRLQGAGAGSTLINGNPTPVSLLDAWHARIQLPLAQGGLNGQALENFGLRNIFSENEAPCIIVFGEQYFPDGTILVPGADPLANVFNPGYRFGTPDDYSDPNNPVAGVGIPGQARIDGFRLSGSKAGGGIYVALRARGLEISNNEITNNQGIYAGGIAVGVPDLNFQLFPTTDFRVHAGGLQNTEVLIRNNKIHKNGGLEGAGGIVIAEDSHNYRVEGNLITGNYSSFHGGGLAHIGLSDQGLIKDNRILFNESFFGAILQRAGDGGGIYIGGDIAGGTGAGSVTIDANLIQGNMAGAGSGGGIRAASFSGDDVRAIGTITPIPTPWPLYTLTIVNNIIVNNIAGFDGGGLSLQDVSRAVIANNTIANNDSTSVSQRAFPVGEMSSTPYPGGISAHAHSETLNALWAAAVASGVPEFAAGEPTFSDPELTNNIIWHNRSWFFDGTAVDPATGALVGALLPNPAGEYLDLDVVGETAALTPVNCILSGGPDPLFVSEYFNTLEAATVIDEGGNNINIRFLPLEVGISDYHLTGASPAIDAGAAVSGPLLAFDFDDDARPGGPATDIGADEYAAAPPVNDCPADLNGDGVVDFADMSILRSNFGNTCAAGQPCPGDVNLDGTVNFDDLTALRAVFGTNCP